MATNGNRGNNARGNNGNSNQQRRPQGSCFTLKDLRTGDELRLKIDDHDPEIKKKIKDLVNAHLRLGKKKLTQPKEDIPQKHRLIHIGSVPQRGILVVVLARVDDANNGVVCDERVRYVDPLHQHGVSDVHKTLQIADFDEIEIAELHRDINARQVTFYLPECPEEKIVIDVPAKKRETTPTETHGLKIAGQLIGIAVAFTAIVVAAAQGEWKMVFVTVIATAIVAAITPFIKSLNKGERHEVV